MAPQAPVFQGMENPLSSENVFLLKAEKCMKNKQ
jgi:hypothetical protein